MQDTNLSKNLYPHGASPTSRSTRRVLTTTGAIAAVVLVAIIAALFFHGVFGRSGPTGPDPQLELTSISMVSASEGWAVGGQDWNSSRSDDGSGTTVLYHYKNGRWSLIYIPISNPAISDGSHPVLQTVSMVSATDGWAAGSFENGPYAFFLHYDGTSWKEVDPLVTPSELQYFGGKPHVPAFFDLSTLQMLSATDGWAAGGTLPQSDDFALLHYTGSAWVSTKVDDPHCYQTIPPTPESYTCMFMGLDMISPVEGWAVGISGYSGASDTEAAVIAHVAGGQWSIQARFPNATLQRVVMVSATEGWAIGTQSTAASDNEWPLLLHYVNGTWSKEVSPLETLPGRDSYIGALSFLSPEDGWLTVSEYAGQDKMAADHPVLLHYTGGRWTQVVLPTVPGRVAVVINGLTMVSPQEGWAVGTGWLPPSDGKLNASHIGFSTPSRPLILHYFHGAWSLQVT